MNKALKYTLLVTGIFFLLFLALLLFTQSAFFREKIKQQLLTQSAKFLNLELQIDELNGNLFSELELKNLRLYDEGKEVLSLQSLKIHYNLLLLFQKQIRIDSIMIDSPGLQFWQEQDSSWSFESYLAEQEPAKDTVTSEFPFQITAPQITLRNGMVQIDALTGLIPKQITAMNLSAGFTYTSNELAVDLRDLNLKTNEPDLKLKKLSGSFFRGKDEMRLDHFVLRTSGSEADAGGAYQSVENFNGTLDAGRIDSSELAVFLPDIHLKCSPKIRTQLRTSDNVLTGSLEISHNTESVAADFSVENFSNLTRDGQPLPFTLKLLFNDFEIQNWLDINEIQAKLEGTVQVAGNDLLHPENGTKVTANLTNSSYNAVNFLTFGLDGNWLGNAVSGRLQLTSGFGDVELSGTMQNLKTTQDYNIAFRTNELNLEAFVPEMEHTVLNAFVHAEGSGFRPENLSIRANLELWDSRIYGFQIDSLASHADFIGNVVRFDSLHAMVPGAQARGQGIVRLDSMQMSATFHLKADSLAVVDSLVDLPVRFDSLVADVSIFGPFSRLQMEGEAETFNASAYDAQMDQMQARFQIDVNGDSLEVRSQAEARHITYQGFHWDSLNVEMRYIPEILQLRAGLFLPDTFDLRFETSIGLDSILNVEVPALQANTLFADYYLKDTLRLKVDGTTRFSIENLQLLDQNNPDFLLQVEGLVSMTDTNDLKVELKDFGLNQLNEWLPAEDSLYGRLNSTFSLSGSPRNPELSGAIHLSEAGFGNYGLSALNGTIHFEDSKVTSEITIPELGETFKTTVEVPLSAYVDSMQMVYSQPDSFEASVVLENFDIRELGKQFVPRDSLKGRLNMNLNARGTLQNPQVFGTIRLDQASYQNKQVGLDYKNVLASVLFDGNRMKIDSVLIQQKKGFLTLTGELAFDTSLITGNIVASSLQADARNFFLSQNRNYEILIDATTFLKNSNGQPEFGGKIKVLRSDIFLPALMKESQPGPDADVPMLVQALQTPDTIQVSDTIEHHFVSPGEIQNIFLEKLRGKMNVEIPRNTWVRSDDMRLELNGDVDIVKNGPDFELFGSVGINRGYYLLYGKKLNVEESTITFEGGEEFDPVLNFKAEHIFRGSDRGKRYLELLMTGKLSEPTISFKLDGTEITENDGVSVLLFGTTADEIGFSEQEGMIGSISSQALASLITTQLSKTIGTQFNLDMIEITATDNWQSAAFVVGKYITNDIFVIYERGFGEVDGDEITPETITVEYELNDKLFLRLQSGSSITSGIDLILKFEEKQKKANLSRK